MSNPLAEVFGFPTDTFSDEARRARANRLCPFGNVSPNCTKSSVEHPIGVCSVIHGTRAVVTCPVRFREGGRIIADAASFLLPSASSFTTIPEVRLKDETGRPAGNIDYVLVAHDEMGRVTDYGALEVQSVYISGNIRTPFLHYLEAPEDRDAMDWLGPNYPRPDFLSSSRKRLAPQLLTKGGILHQWGRRLAVVVDLPFFETLPPFATVEESEAEVCWLVYALERQGEVYKLRLAKKVYTRFLAALATLTHMKAGDETAFIAQLGQAIKRMRGGLPLDTGTLLIDDE